jgi:hypothetical protein
MIVDIDFIEIVIEIVIDPHQKQLPHAYRQGRLHDSDYLLEACARRRAVDFHGYGASHWLRRLDHHVAAFWWSRYCYGKSRGGHNVKLDRGNLRKDKTGAKVVTPNFCVRLCQTQFGLSPEHIRHRVVRDTNALDGDGIELLWVATWRCAFANIRRRRLVVN